jgi:hypothetical protein
MNSKPKKKAGNVYLFQYGSNMSSRRLNSAQRLGGAATPIGRARLDGWGIRFDLYSETNKCAVTDIRRSHAEHVWGALFCVPRELVIAPSGRSRMDEIEGAGKGERSNYRRETIYARRGRYLVQAETYVGTAPARHRFNRASPVKQRVSKKYFAYLIKGSRENRLPKSYVAYLKRQAGGSTPTR